MYLRRKAGVDTRSLLHSVALMKYVSVYRRSRSPYWYLSFHDAATGRRKHKATVHRVDAPMGRRKALDEANELSREATASKSAAGDGQWGDWVEPYLRDRHAGSPGTCAGALGCWSHIREFLHDAKVLVPRALTYRHVVDFVGWRTLQRKKRGTRFGTTISKNTALREVGVLGSVMQEACRRGFAVTNPARGTGIKHVPAKVKPEITEQELATVREKLPVWVAKDAEVYGYMPMAFEIAIHQGCRLTETSIPFDRIDFERGVVTLHTKGGKRFATRLHAALRPMLLARRDAGHPSSCVVPRFASLHWRKFFDWAGLTHLCFHCTRVTVVTRLARAGVPMSQAMSYVGHSSRLVHRVYTRLQPGDLSACEAALS